MNKCPQCGGNIPQNSYVCEYCGFIKSDKLKRANKSNSFEEAMSIIQENLNAIHNIKNPSIKSGVVAALRVLAAIYTLGLVLIFWRKPKKRFDKKGYESLRSIIKRNISQLKIGSKGSSNLMSRIKVVENELEEVDKKIKKNLRAKRFTIVLTIAAFFALIFINNKLNPPIIHNISPVELTVFGDLKDTLVIVPDNFELKYRNKKFVDKLKIGVTIKAIQKRVLEKNEELKVSLVLTDKDGKPSALFYPSTIGSFYVNNIKDGLEKGNKDVGISCNFVISAKKVIKKIPQNITNFKIVTEITPIKEKE